MKYSQSTNTIVSYNVETAQPLDIKGFFKDINDMRDVVNNDPLSYYEEMVVKDSSTGKTYRWIESSVGVISGGFTYPDNYIHDTVDYSLKTFNFVEIGNYVTVFKINDTFPPLENYPQDSIAIRQFVSGSDTLTGIYKKTDNNAPGNWTLLFQFAEMISDSYLTNLIDTKDSEKESYLVPDSPLMNIEFQYYNDATSTWEAIPNNIYKPLGALDLYSSDKRRKVVIDEIVWDILTDGPGTDVENLSLSGLWTGKLVKTWISGTNNENWYKFTGIVETTGTDNLICVIDDFVFEESYYNSENTMFFACTCFDNGITDTRKIGVIEVQNYTGSKLYISVDTDSENTPSKNGYKKFYIDFTIKKA